MDNQYERKLELVRAVREENRSNIARMNHRESILYGCTSRTIEPLGYQSGSYGTKAMESVGQESELDNFKVGNGFFVRSMAAIALVVVFWGMKEDKIAPVFGITDSKIVSYVKEDFSNKVVDYMKDFTYTLGYEKTSIK